MRIVQSIVLMGVVALLGCQSKSEKNETTQTASADTATMVYEANWESLARHDESPEWFEDAKFGIYFHWGLYTVPAFGSEWYPRNMHFSTTNEYKHHVKTYGLPSEFGYHDFVPMFKAENFNAEEWAELFEKAGARFAGPVAEHHDGFAMWDSKATPWNAADKGPKKDVTGLLAKAIKERGMKFITTFHHSRNLQRYVDNPESQDTIERQTRRFWNSHYPFIEGMPPTSTDPELRKLYGYMTAEKWLEKIWMGKLKEVIDNYKPDIIWFDSWLDEIPEEYQRQFCAYYLNAAEQWGKEVVIMRKQDDLPLTVSLIDLERSRKNEISERAWMTDEAISPSSWSYTEGMEIKDAQEIIHVLVDIVSKNGVLLFNISPKSDGSIPPAQKEVLLKMGAWLDNYGGAIYGTRPWYTFGEGPTKQPEGSFKHHRAFQKLTYTNEDIRYTTKGDTIYAIVMGSPEPNKELILTAFAKDAMPEAIDINTVERLGSEEDVTWEQSDKGLTINVSPNAPEEMATVFRIGHF